MPVRVSRRLAAGLGVLALVTACGTAPASPSATPLGNESPSVAASASATASAQPTPADLSERPLAWFAPLPPLPTGPGRPYIGSEDFMDLWEPGAPWDQAARRVSVFKLYGEWVDRATAAQLRTAVEGIRERGMVLAVEAGPLDPRPGCGQGVEGFAGSGSGRRLAEKIRAAGGVLQVIALDEPWYFGHVYSGPSACHLPVDEIAAGVADFVAG